MSSSKVKPVPDGYRSVTPYMIIDGAASALEFYARVFGAKERMRMPAPGGKVGHAEITIGDSVIMLSDEAPEMDATVKAAMAAGARVIAPVENKFYGDRSGTIEDPFGHHWHVATHTEDVSPEEMARRAAAMSKQSS
jgi:PhnB protein